jgi:pyrimidine-nucleoside phosphorylase
MRIQDIIAAKRDGGTLTEAQLRWFVEAYLRDEVKDYQASALLMAIYLRGMDANETAALTKAMADSGQRLDPTAIAAGRPTLDKHSTGGVGDKTTLVVVPLLAAAGIAVCKMSGRGLGHTGGTLDKLEAIPGFRVGLSPEEMLSQVGRIGACLAGQTADLAPADKRLYALRDATATVGSLPLIVSSILSKKLAGGADSFLFDVKVGSGALMRTEDDARALAQTLVDGAAASGKQCIAVLSDMNQPLGNTIGNALEVAEAIRTLTPGTESVNARFRELCLTLTAEGLRLTGIATGDEARQTAERLLISGAALTKFREIVEAQGGDTSVVEEPMRLPKAPIVSHVPSPETGYVTAIDTAELGNIVVALGGGRARKEDTIDPAVGLVIHAAVGAKIAKGESLAEIHARSGTEADAAVTRIQGAYTIRDTPLPPSPLIFDVLRS